MIRAIIDASLRNRLQVIIATLIIVAAGVWALRNIPLDAISDLSDVQVIGFTEFSGQAPVGVDEGMQRLHRARVQDGLVGADPMPLAREGIGGERDPAAAAAVPDVSPIRQHPVAPQASQLVGVYLVCSVVLAVQPGSPTSEFVGVQETVSSSRSTAVP